MSEWACVPLIARFLWRWEPEDFIAFFDFGCFQKAVYILNSIIMVFVQKTEIGLTGLFCFVCSGVSIEKFAICIAFLSAYG